MSKDAVISVNAVSKKFCRNLRRSMLYGIADLGQELIGKTPNYARLRDDEFWALQDVSFTVERGEKLGFLGVNGSGKSTLLRLINGIFPPDTGFISVRGRVGALIAVGVGFHPHMTGRENVYLNGTILGMSRKEITQKFEAIIDFAEIGEFIDAPVLTYSSGMTVRLGFAIAIHAEVDIMLVDEVLAVGDFAFSLKCQKKLSAYYQQGGTFILVSHNMQLIRNTCERVIWLDAGKIQEDGKAWDICNHYETAQIQKLYHTNQIIQNVINFDKTVSLTNIEFLNRDNLATTQFETGDCFRVHIRFDAARPVFDPIFTISLFDPDGTLIFENYSNQETERIASIKGKGEVQFIIDKLNVRPNIYECSITWSEKDIMNKLEWHERAYKIVVTNSRYAVNQGIMYPYPQWRFINTSIHV